MTIKYILTAVRNNISYRTIILGVSVFLFFEGGGGFFSYERS